MKPVSSESHCMCRKGNRPLYAFSLPVECLSDRASHMSVCQLMLSMCFLVSSLVFLFPPRFLPPFTLYVCVEASYPIYAGTFFSTFHFLLRFASLFFGILAISLLSYPSYSPFSPSLFSFSCPDIKQVVDTKIADVNFNLKMSSDMVREKFEQLKKELDVRCKVLLDDLQLKSRAEIDKLTEHAKALVGFQKRVDAVRDGTVASRVPVTNEELRMLHVLGGVDTVPLMEDAEVSQEQDKKDVDCALKIVLDR